MPRDFDFGFDTGIPFRENPAEDSAERTRERNRRLLLLGGAMNAAGSYLGPVYPLLLDPMAEDEEKDPNP